jgi:hypothetical protein
MILLEWKISLEENDEKCWAYDPKTVKKTKGKLRSRLPENIQEIEHNERLKLSLNDLF